MNFLRDGEYPLAFQNKKNLKNVLIEADYYGFKEISEFIQQIGKDQCLKSQDLSFFSSNKSQSVSLMDGRTTCLSSTSHYTSLYIEDPILVDCVTKINSKTVNYIEFTLQSIQKGGVYFGCQKRDSVSSAGFKNCLFPSYYEGLKQGTRIGVWADVENSGLFFYHNDVEFYRYSSSTH